MPNLPGGTTGGGVIGCFLGDTIVDISIDQSLPIEQIYEQRESMIGGPVLSFDVYGEIRADQLADVYRYRVFEYREVYFRGRSRPNRQTEMHRYWSESKEFVPVRGFEVGDKFHRRIGRSWEMAEVVEVKTVSVPEGVWVYNLTTEIYHHYLADGMAVHNAKAPLDPGGPI